MRYSAYSKSPGEEHIGTGIPLIYARWCPLVSDAKTADEIPAPTTALAVASPTSSANLRLINTLPLRSAIHRGADNPLAWSPCQGANLAAGCVDVRAKNSAVRASLVALPYPSMLKAPRGAVSKVGSGASCHLAFIIHGATPRREASEEPQHTALPHGWTRVLLDLSPIAGCSAPRPARSGRPSGACGSGDIERHFEVRRRKAGRGTRQTRSIGGKPRGRATS